MKDMTIEQLNEKLAANTATILTLATDEATDEQLDEADKLDAENVEINAELASRETAATKRAERLAGLRDTYAADNPEDPEDPEEPETAATEEPEEPEEPEETEEGADAPEAVTAGAARGGAPTLLRKKVAKRNKAPEAPVGPAPAKVTITAGADITGFATGQKMDNGTVDIASALVARTGNFPKFNPGRARGMAAQSDGAPVMHKFGIANLGIEFEDGLRVKTGSPDEALAVSAYAGSVDRLAGKSLTAAGWCSPSETVYDLCEGETLDGIASVPEMSIERGGINYTGGPTFADFYATGFFQTEAEAIAGEEKDCHQVECPEFAEVRLDAIGLCLTTPILTEAAYPELTRRFVSGSLVGHAHRINKYVLDKITAGSTAQTIALGNLAFGSSASDTFAALGIIAAGRREKYRLGLQAAMEVILPHWVREVIREDIARRNSVALDVVTDANIDAEFRNRKLNVQWVYDWDGILNVATDGTPAYPTTFRALMYPAGTWTKGTAPVINLSAVYDAASLKINQYTGLFMEQGILMVKNCFDSDVVTIPVCSAGRTGASNFTCA